MNRIAGNAPDEASLFIDLKGVEQLEGDQPMCVDAFGPDITPESGEIRLVRAILRDAIKCFQKYSVHPTSHTRQAQDELRSLQQWFSQDDDSYPTSFVNVCSLLGLDPGLIRLSLEAWREK